MLLGAVLMSGCAGEVGKYRNEAAGPAVTATGPAPATEAAVGADATAPLTASGPSPALGPEATRPSGPAQTQRAPGDRGQPVPAAAPTAGRASASPSGAGGGPPAGAATREAAATAAPTGAPGGGGSTGPSAGTPGPPPPVGGGSTVGVTRDTVTIGLFYPKTGAYAGLLRNIPAVAQAAFDEAGPINGRRVVLRTYDDGTANAATIQVEEKRAKDESFALLSGVGESNVVLAPLVDQHHVPAVIANIDEQVALPLKYVFAVTAYWRRQAVLLPGFIKNELGGAGKRIGVVYEGTSTARNGKDAFKARAAELGLDVVFEQPIAQNQSACANEVANLQAHRVEVVFMMNGPLGAVCMLRDARALNFRPTWTGVGASWNFNVVATASGGAADGVRTLATSTTLETPAGRRYAAFARKYLPNSGAEDDDVMLLGYGFTQTVIEGLRRTGPDLTREAFVQTFETTMNGFDSGFLPPPTFGPGNRSGPVVVGVTACCTAGRWSMPRVGWRANF
jgi:branched-chain amino acid transport system substrate-binding protein